jgi:hypothetical protein
MILNFEKKTNMDAITPKKSNGFYLILILVLMGSLAVCGWLIILAEILGIVEEVV